MSRFAPILDIVKVVLIVFVVALIIRIFLVQPFIVEGSSMEPDFHDREYILIEKVSYRLKTPERGDVIVFHYPNNPSINYIKRIIGLPGETIHIENGEVAVNGKLIFEPYLMPNQSTVVNGERTRSYEVQLADDQFFVLGDNRDHSSDSREWGPLAKRFIIGRSALVMYPTKDFQAITSPNY